MKIAIISTIVASALMAATPLMQDAKKAGLMPIPSKQKELNKLIDNPKNPITYAKVELGKNFSLIQDFQKVDLSAVIHVTTLELVELMDCKLLLDINGLKTLTI